MLPKNLMRNKVTNYFKYILYSYSLSFGSSYIHFSMLEI
jgi:hypothetical protein